MTVRSTSRGHAFVFLCLLGAATSCESKTEQQLKDLNISEEQAKRILQEISGHPPAPELPRTQSGTAQSENPRAKAAPQSLEPSLVSEDWVVDGLVDVAPAAPSVAVKEGVVVINGKNELWLAKLSGLGRGKQPTETRLSGLSDSQGPFALGRGPTVADGYAYWVTSHFLLRRPINPPFGPLEILAEDARVGTRTAILPKSKERKRDSAWVAYIALPSEKNGPLRAKMWHGEKSRLLLTPPGNSALSVDLYDTGSRVFALSVEARTGATTLHSRELLPRPRPFALTDEIVWVGGGAHPMTELHLVKPRRRLSPQLVGLMTLDQDVTHFGLVALGFDDITQRAQPKVNWTLYKNGLDPAPISSATLCGRSVALFARPSDSSPGAPQELVLAELQSGQLGSEVILAHSKAFYDISLAGLDKRGKRGAGLAQRGALLSYVADYRTWGRTIRCLTRR